MAVGCSGACGGAARNPAREKGGSSQEGTGKEEGGSCQRIGSFTVDYQTTFYPPKCYLPYTHALFRELVAVHGAAMRQGCRQADPFFQLPAFFKDNNTFREGTIHAQNGAVNECDVTRAHLQHHRE